VTLLGDDEFRVAHDAAHALRRLGRAGLAALREVVDDERVEAGDHGAHARPSSRAAHAEEALALAAIAGEPELVGAR
jgi:hypothetical protein